MKTKELKDIVVRLRVEKERNAKEWVRAGISGGIHWAMDAEYPNLKDWATRAHIILEHSPGVAWDSVSLPEELEDDLKELHSGEMGPAFDCAAYTEGWMVGVSQFWSQVEGQI